MIPVTESLATYYLYVPNSVDGPPPGYVPIVSIIDTLRGTVVGTIPVGQVPVSGAITPDGTRVYVCNSISNTVSAIDTATRSVVATISVGTQPQYAVVTPDGGHVYVGNSGSNTVSVISTSSNTVVATVTGLNFPGALVVTPDGSHVYITNEGAGTVSVITTSSNTVTATITVGTTPVGIAITPNGAQVYVANNASNTVSVIDVATNTVTTTIDVPLEPYGVVVSPDGNTCYVSTPNSGLLVITTSTNVVTRTIAVSDLPMGLAMTPDGATLYACSQYVNLVSVVDVSRGRMFNTIPVSQPVAAIVTPSLVYATPPLVENDPNSPNSTAVQVANASGFTLGVQSGGYNYSIAPYSVDTIPTNSGNPLVVTFSTTNVQSPGYATFYWLQARDAPPLADGPLYAQGTAGAIG